jgi:S1-C subfamily serine protease
MDSIEKSVVQVIGDYYNINYSYPWSAAGHYRGSGSGFCIYFQNRKYILTNAHCVHNTTRIYLRMRGRSELVSARIVWIVYECDLALLEAITPPELPVGKKAKASEPEVFDLELEPLKFGHLPQKLDKVYVYGYPLGGLNVSVTKGVVNRIQIIKYFEVVRSIAVQVDAPINFGNSGGPVINKEGMVVGVAFAGEDPSYTENMGYMIPLVLVRYFLESVPRLDGFIRGSASFSGLCDLGIVTEPLHNRVLRGYLDLPADNSGVVIVQVFPTGVAKDYLHPDDVLLSIDGKSINNDGTINLGDVLSYYDNETSNLSEGEIVLYRNYVHMKKPGDKINLVIWRGGKLREIQLTMKPYHYVVPKFEYQSMLSYYMIMGLLFLPVSFPLIQEKYRNNEYVAHLVECARYYQPKKAGEQVIILADIVDNEFTKEFPSENYILKSINRVRILNMEHLKETIKAQLKKAEYLRFEFKHRGSAILLKTIDVKRHNTQIIKDIMGSVPDHFV